MQLEVVLRKIVVALFSSCHFSFGAFLCCFGGESNAAKWFAVVATCWDSCLDSLSLSFLPMVFA